jgi:hypothetical protein
MEEPTQPKLWNPNAAANWSLLFSPIFGAWLHAKNWKELGKEDEAKKSMFFAYGYMVLLILFLFLPIPDALGRLIGLGALIGWYFSHGKTQVKHVENGVHYEKKSWLMPILAGFVGLIVYFGIAIGIGLSSQPSIKDTLEKESVSVVTQIVSEQSTLNTKCRKVTITEELPDKSYRAIAHLENGNTLNISIKIKGDQFYVEIPAQ